MNAILAKNVKTIRQAKNWTQQHCADAAGILLRTVQRVENADGASTDTLAALSNAFGLPVTFLQTDLDAVAADIEQQRAELLKTHDLVPVAPILTVADLNLVGGVHGNMMDCKVKDDRAQDAFAAFQTEVADLIDIWEDATPVQRLEWMRDAFRHVEELNGLGCVVAIGRARGKYKMANGNPIELVTVYVVVWPKELATDVIAVPKDLGWS